jgi:hypothetical protein
MTASRENRAAATCRRKRFAMRPALRAHAKAKHGVEIFVAPGERGQAAERALDLAALASLRRRGLLD